MRSVYSVLVPFLVFLLTSCSSDSDPFGPYKTAFQLKSGCTLNVEKSKVTANCSDITIEADLDTEEVSLRKAKFTETLSSNDCYESYSCDLVYLGVANKKGGKSTKDGGAAADKGASGDGSEPQTEPPGDGGGTTGADGGTTTSSNKGLFTPLEGEWEGKLRLDKTCKVKMKSSAPGYCNASPSGTTQYTFKATVQRHSVSFTWDGGDTGSGSFDVIETKGGVRAAGTFYPRVESKSSGDGGSSKTD